ncbi:MAG: ATP-dependent zinc metalloprotease FtsH [Solirubrobacterales bacterium]
MFKDKKFDKNKIKYIVYYLILVAVVIYAINDYRTNVESPHVKYSEFVNYLNQKQIQDVQIAKDRIIIYPKASLGKGKKLFTENISDPELLKRLDAAGVIYGGVEQENSTLRNVLVTFVLPILIFLFIGKLLFGKLDKKMGTGVISFGKNTAKIYGESRTGISFEDVAAQEEAKESLVEIVDFLHNPQKYAEIGAKLPKGALLVGPPGTGKTLLAKAVAGEAKVPFFSISGSGFVEMFVGMGASRVRDLFEQAQEKAPCIIFIDEIDAIGKSRDAGMVQGNDEREQTLNQLLAEMDGFDSSKGVVILAATNRPEVLDKALLRPGRFDRRVIVDRPDLKGREDILRVHSKGVKISKEVDFLELAKATPGAVGADLANIINEAALRAVKNNRKEVIQEDLEDAVEVIIAGKEKKDRIMSPKEKRIVAFHEVGHALVAALKENSDPVHKITIVPRTMGALGYTMQLPVEEKFLVSKEEMLGQIAVMLGGRAAEEVEFGIISTGAANDIERATETARRMVTMYGMSEKFDMMGLESIENRYLDGRPVQSCSAETASLIDNETLKIIKENHQDAVNILKANKDLLVRISEKLLEKETLMGDEFMDMVRKG